MCVSVSVVALVTLFVAYCLAAFVAVLLRAITDLARAHPREPVLVVGSALVATWLICGLVVWPFGAAVTLALGAGLWACGVLS